MAVMITPAGSQTFIDGEAVNRLARNADTVKLAHRGPMQRQYTLTMTYQDKGETHTTSCDIVANVPSYDDDLLNMAAKARK